jgi:hypothetical protein
MPNRLYEASDRFEKRIMEANSWCPHAAAAQRQAAAVEELPAALGGEGAPGEDRSGGRRLASSGCADTAAAVGYGAVALSAAGELAGGSVESD